MAVEDTLCGFDDAEIGEHQCRENHEKLNRRWLEAEVAPQSRERKDQRGSAATIRDYAKRAKTVICVDLTRLASG